MAFLFTVVGVLALLNYWNAEVGFWTQAPIESEMGKDERFAQQTGEWRRSPMLDCSHSSLPLQFVALKRG